MERLIAILVLLCCLDSSILKAQEEVVPYRKGNLWGLADSALNILLEPKYDSIGLTYLYGMAKGEFERVNFFKSNGKIGMLREQKEVIPAKHQKLTFRYGFVRSEALATNRSLAFYYTAWGDLIKPYPIQEVSKVYRLLEILPKHLIAFKVRTSENEAQLAILNLKSEIKSKFLNPMM